MPLLYRIDLCEGGAAIATKVEALGAILRRKRPGRYPIVEVDQGWALSRERPWGVAIVRDDGTIELNQEA